jgi:hypothetical protein
VASTTYYGNRTVPVDVSVISDISGNGMPEVIMHGQDAGTNQVKAQIRDYASGDLVRNMFFGTSYGPVQLDVISDVSGDGMPDVCHLGRRLDTGAVRIQLKSSVTGDTVSTAFTGNSNYPIGAAGVGDVNGNGASDIALLVQDSSGTAKVTVWDGATGSFIRNIFLGSIFDPQGVAMIGDINANGSVELAVAGNTTTVPSVQIADSDSGEKLSLIVLP